MIFVLLLISSPNMSLFCCVATEFQYVCMSANIFELRISQQALRLSTSARRKTSVGEIINLMSVDAQKLQDAPVYLHGIWVAPLVVVLCMYFLWQQLGPSAFAGLLFVLFMIPLNCAFAEKMRKLQVTTGFVSPKGTAI